MSEPEYWSSESAGDPRFISHLDLVHNPTFCFEFVMGDVISWKGGVYRESDRYPTGGEARPFIWIKMMVMRRAPEKNIWRNVVVKGVQAETLKERLGQHDIIIAGGELSQKVLEYGRGPGESGPGDRPKSKVYTFLRAKWLRHIPRYMKASARRRQMVTIRRQEYEELCKLRRHFQAWGKEVTRPEVGDLGDGSR